jgi:hypothetical protein
MLDGVAVRYRLADPGSAGDLLARHFRCLADNA